MCGERAALRGGPPPNIEAIMWELGLSEASPGLDAPKAVESSELQHGGDRELWAVEAASCCRIAALANYVSSDRPDLQAAISNLLWADLEADRRGTCGLSSSSRRPWIEVGLEGVLGQRLGRVPGYRNETWRKHH